mmetsp:Transcript_85595/g.239010  ORF Transcript_85595/g.239010 Transcript_85595/m.239010 type:complete len:228 (-) Transcript_85595:118-801(-)
MVWLRRGMRPARACSPAPGGRPPRRGAGQARLAFRKCLRPIERYRHRLTATLLRVASAMPFACGASEGASADATCRITSREGRVARGRNVVVPSSLAASSGDHTPCHAMYVVAACGPIRKASQPPWCASARQPTVQGGEHDVPRWLFLAKRSSRGCGARAFAVDFAGVADRIAANSPLSDDCGNPDGASTERGACAIHARHDRCALVCKILRVSTREAGRVLSAEIR